MGMEFLIDALSLMKRFFGLVLQERCTRTIALAYIGSVLLCIPSFITFDVEQQLVTINSDGLTINQTHLTAPSWGSSLVPPTDNSSMALIYIVNLNPIAKNHDGLIHKVNLSIHIVEKLHSVGFNQYSWGSFKLMRPFIYRRREHIFQTMVTRKRFSLNWGIHFYNDIKRPVDSLRLHRAGQYVKETRQQQYHSNQLARSLPNV